MSLVNIWVSKRHAIVCVDTSAKRADGTFYSASKMVPIGHANVMLAVQGSLDLLTGAFAGLHQSAIDLDFDQLERDMPGLLRSSVDALSAHCAAGGMSDNQALTPSKFFMVGWSEARGSMAGLGFLPLAGKHDVEVLEAKDWLLAPGDVPALRNTLLRPTEDGMREIAEIQVRHHFAADPGVAIGGPLLLADLWQTEMAIKRLRAV